MVTIKDVAKRANVSVATASRALRNIGYINRDTLKKVSDAANELNYIADRGAQQLRNGKGNLVGVIVSDIKNYFYNITLSKLVARLKRTGQIVLLAYSNENEAEERDSFITLLSAKVSTIIFTPVSDKNHDLVEKAKSNDIRLVQLYRRVYDDVAAVLFDDELGAYLGAKHLIESGCRRPMLIGVRYYTLPSDKVCPNRTLGFTRALSECGAQESRVIEHPLLDDMGPELKKELTAFRPDGIIAGNNTFTLELLKVLKENGVVYPRDVKIVAFDDIEWAPYLELTAIRQPIDTLVEQLFETITQQPPATPAFIKVPPALIVRRSTAE